MTSVARRQNRIFEVSTARPAQRVACAARFRYQPRHSRTIIPVAQIEQKIIRLRDHNLMLDGDLADLYGVEVRTLNQAVKRDLDRLPDDFMFQLPTDEHARLRRWK